MVTVVRTLCTLCSEEGLGITVGATSATSAGAVSLVMVRTGNSAAR